MSNERTLKSLEKRITNKIRMVKMGNLSPGESGIGRLLKLIKPLDEVLYSRTLKEYKVVYLKLEK